MNLQQSKVVFDHATHTYHLDGVQLQGITGLITRQLFPDKYANIPKKILKAAAERGIEIHAACQSYDMFSNITDDTMQEVKNYASLCTENDIKMIDNEYLVSDDTHYATMIDVLDDNYNLYDIKTTAVLDEDYLSWQLSICAYLFEFQNPLLQAGKLYGIWLRGEIARLVEVERKPVGVIAKLLETDKQGIQFVNPYAKETPVLSNSEEILMLETAIIQLKNEIKEYEEKKEQMLATLEAEMERLDLKKWETDRMSITRVLPTVSKTLDSKLLQEKQPEVYNAFLKETTRKGYVKITIK